MATITLDAQNGPDQSSEIQDAMNSLKPEDTLVFNPGLYVHSKSLAVAASWVTVTGYGAELEATSADDQSIIMSGDNTTIVGFKMTGTGSTRLTTPNSTKIQITGNGNQVLHNTIRGGASSGIFNFGGQNSVIYLNDVSGTLADGIHVTYGARNVLIQGNTVTQTGDDMIAVVSYTGDGNPCKNVLIIGNNVSGNTWGRGITVVGGANVTITGNIVSDVRIGAGILVGQEDSYATFDTSEVLITHNRISNIQMDAPDDATKQGGIEIGADSGKVSFIELTANTITNSFYEGIRVLGNVAQVRISGNTLINIPEPGTPVTLLQNAGFEPVIIDGSNLLDGAPLVPPPKSIASGSFFITGASAQLLPTITTSAMRL